MRHVIGIDAGATKTVGLLAAEDGRVVREARDGGANLVIHGEAGVQATLGAILASLSPRSTEAICLGMAGVDRPDDKGRVRAILDRLGAPATGLIVNDAHVALVAGACEPCGIVIVSGTGSIAYGMDASGRTARAGGWGYLLGDEGSAYWLGHAAVRMGIRSTDGRGPQTMLFDRIAARLGVSDPGGLVRWFYDHELSRDRVARLASVVQEAADAGDEPARGLLDQAGRHLADAARAVAARLAFVEPFPLVLAGGAFEACPALAARVEHHLGLPLARPARLEREPAHGAVRLALGLLR